MGWHHLEKPWLIRKIQNKVHCMRFQSNKGIRLWRNFSPYSKHQALINIGYYYKAICNIVWFYKEVLNSSNAYCWVQVTYEEIESLKENDVFELTPSPKGKKMVGSKWVYTIQKSPNGSEKHKASFVAWRFSQRKELDYQETFFPYCKHPLNMHLNANGSTILSDCPSDGCNNSLCICTIQLWNFYRTN